MAKTLCTADADCTSIAEAKSDACCAKWTLTDWVSGGAYDGNTSKQNQHKSTAATLNIPGEKGATLNACVPSKKEISINIQSYKT